jgi:hypothetical protein
MALALRSLGLLGASARRVSFASKPRGGFARVGVRAMATDGGDGASRFRPSIVARVSSSRRRARGSRAGPSSPPRSSRSPSPPTPANVAQSHRAPPAGFAEDAVLLALKNPTLMDVRGVEGKGEIAENPSPAGAVNVAWNTAGGEFFDASKLPADKTAPVIVF